ncbi:MAG: hypothetical protein QXD69_06175, partial [Candidatus Bathyarchaeia archaeon]
KAKTLTEAIGSLDSSSFKSLRISSRLGVFRSAFQPSAQRLSTYGLAILRDPSTLFKGLYA